VCVCFCLCALWYCCCGFGCFVDVVVCGCDGFHGFACAGQRRLNGGLVAAWWRGHWMHSGLVVCLCGMSLVGVGDVVGVG
jgi:hypothetical protein